VSDLTFLDFSVFNFPFHNRGDTLGNLFVASKERIYLISAVNSLVTTFVGNPSSGSTVENIAATSVLISSNEYSTIRITGDSFGNVYYIDDCRIRKVTASSKLVSTVVGSTSCGYNGENTAALSTQLSYPNALWFDTTGNLIIGDYWNYRIRKWTVSTGLVTTIAGTGTDGFSDNLPATSAMFYSVYDIIGDTNGNIYFSDWSNNRVRKITSSGILVTYAGDGACCSFTENSLATSSHMYHPTGLQIDSNGKLYISSFNIIAVVDPSTTLLTTIVGLNGFYGYTGDGGPAFGACIVGANSIWIDTNSHFYLTQALYYRIRKVASNIITAFAGTGYYALTGNGGPAKNAQLYKPTSTFVDTNGNVYIADTNNCHIRLVNTAGIISSIGGNVFCQSTGDNGPFSQSSLNYPVGIWKDTTGNLYISEAGKVSISATVNYYMSGISRIRKVSASTNIITTIAGGGGSTTDNILATSYSFGLVSGIWGDTNNNLFIVDTNRNNVKKLSLSSTWLITVAGSGTSGFTDNVPATSGQLFFPYGIWVDELGRLFIADTFNLRIRKVENGIITTFAGTGSVGFNGNGHLATATNLYYTYAVTGDSNGNIYVADKSSCRIRMISAVNNTVNVVTTVIGSGSSSISKGLLQATTASLRYPVHVAVDTNGNLYATEDESAHTIRKTILAASPTSQPSRQPTGQPTRQPLSLPTAQPTRNPTGQPSRQPSLQPINLPSSQPSTQPSTKPSGQPSGRPSSQPSRQPSQQPTGKPSNQPSARPSSPPSIGPTQQPTVVPSGNPSDRPSSQPTRRPTQQPTGLPSEQPSGRPSSQPSRQPSQMPSCRPSNQPSTKPSSLPSVRPTQQPTGLPSGLPTERPSSLPTGRPTQQPTGLPSGKPSERPSSQPSSRPTRQPTSLPSGRPSASPSSPPSTLPTKCPTNLPTVKPSSQPSRQPSVVPSSQPSSLPTVPPSSYPSGKPSSFPSNKPTSQPTEQPYGIPSSQPSSQPSNIPSSLPFSSPSNQPTSLPSGFPSSQPSSKPSHKPSSVPSSCPSDEPTSVPSGFPSGQPSVVPSNQPSSFPTNRPTCVPTSQPSGFPSNLPSSHPSMQPSSYPSGFPSGLPSSQPSREPTSYPTAFPSSNPTVQPTVHIASELKEAITGFYDIKDSLNDKSGNGNNGKAHGGISFTADRFGSEKSSIEFDGNSGYVEVPTRNSGQLITNFTLSFWIYPNISQLLPGTVVFDKSAYLSETCGWSLIYLRAHLFRFSYSVQHSGRRLAVSSNSSSSVLFDVEGTDWSHVTLVKELQNLLAYRNGHLVNSTIIPLSESLPYSSLPLVIGTSKDVLFRNENVNSSSFYSGSLDDIFIYDRALSAGEITKLNQFAAPTSFPSAQPSTKPSIRPSSEPSIKPTGLPTCCPSRIPTQQPSGCPSSQPTFAPSRVPTDQPTNFPSRKPTNSPSGTPSGQPTLQPSPQPIGFPTTQPSIQPSSSPTSCPTTQPSRVPSSCPTSFPSINPSSQPSNQPTQQPFRRPSSVPSSQPNTVPTMVPSVQPFSRPTTQPTSYPSTQPSSQPTKNRFHCTVTDNIFYSPIRDDCVPCPLHSFLNHTGDDTCYCSGGYSQVGIGLTLNCTLCPTGEVSFPGSSNCTQCQSGFFANSESNTCELCPFNFYSNAAGQTQCTPCPAGRATATLGSTSLEQCISPIPNFTLGFFALFLVIVIFSWYIVFGKFQRVSFERKVKIVTPNIEKCKQVLLSEEEFHYQHLIVVQDKKDQQTRNCNFFFFTLLSFLLVIVSVFLIFVFFTYQVFFTSLILWRGLEGDLNLSPILTLLAEGLKDITEYMSLPVNLFYFAALPFLFLFEALASIDLNLSSVSVTCSGSQAPIELLINCFILGLLVIIIRSDYQLLFNVLLHNLNQRFLLNNVEQRLDAVDFRFSRYFFLCVIVTALTSINPFQVGLRYCMGFVRIDTFGKNHGIAHEVTESCNQVPGAPNFDSFLGYMSTIFAWWLILPAMYCLADVVVPKCKQIDLLKKPRLNQDKQSAKPGSKIFPADLCDDETVVKQSNGGNKTTSDQPDDSEERESGTDKSLKDIDSSRLPELTNNFNSKFPGLDEAVVAQLFQEAYHELYKDQPDDEKETKQFNNGRPCTSADVISQPSVFRNAVHKVTKKMPVLVAIYYYCKQKYFLAISVDLWVSNFFSSWITVLKKNTFKAEKEELLHLNQEKKLSIGMTRIITAKVTAVKTPKQFFSLDSGEFIQTMRTYDLEQMKLQQKMDSLWEKEHLENDHSLPSYYELCLIVRDELHDSILEPFSSIFALIGIGHFFTPTGRYYWKVVLNNYKIFLMVCLGIWTDEAVEAYGLEEKSINLSVDGRAFLYKSETTKTCKREILEENKVDSKSSSRIELLSSPSQKFSAQILGVDFPQSLKAGAEQNKSPKKQSRSESEKRNMREVLPAIISVLICSRVILFQIVPSLVLFATVSMTLASFPLFIFNDFLIETLPPFMIYGEINREMAIERELKSFVALHPETKEVLSEAETIRVLSEDYSWRLSLRGIILFWNESRLLQFIKSSLTLFFALLLMIYTRDLLVYLIVILGILFLFFLSKSLVFLLYLGSSLDLKDTDFPAWLRSNRKKRATAVVPEEAEGPNFSSIAHLDHSNLEKDENVRKEEEGGDHASSPSSLKHSEHNVNERPVARENRASGNEERSYDEEKRSLDDNGDDLESGFRLSQFRCESINIQYPL
jgi:hypothetical protein